MGLFKTGLLFLVLTFSIAAMSHAAAGGSPVIAAAASVNAALNELVHAFANETQNTLRVSFGSSGNIARQIIQGAPFQLFLSADESFARILHRRGLTNGPGTIYATGRVVLYTPHGSTLAGAQIRDLPQALDDGRLQRLAIANPDHAPYGRAAREVLQQLGLWQQMQSKLVIGENISQAAQFAASGSVDAGLIAYATALAPRIKRGGRFMVLPETMHQPLRHRMVLLRDAGPVAESFYAFMQSDASRIILRKYGLQVPAAAER